VVKLEDLKTGASVQGVLPNQVVTVVSAHFMGEDACTLVYRDSKGNVGERMLFRDDEATLALGTEGRPCSFDCVGADFRVALRKPTGFTWPTFSTPPWLFTRRTWTLCLIRLPRSMSQCFLVKPSGFC